MTKTKNRRRKKRWNVAVLVRCAIPHLGDDVYEMEMWARDVNENGLKLEWTKGLTVSQVTKSGETGASKNLRFEDVKFAKGTKIKVQDLFYDDEGSPFIEGKVNWSRKVASSESWELGIEFTDPKRQSQALLGAFKDFLTIVKNPLGAIEKASRQK